VDLRCPRVARPRSEAAESPAVQQSCLHMGPVIPRDGPIFWGLCLGGGYGGESRVAGPCAPCTHASRVGKEGGNIDDG
jgi:hypothetical protein